MRDHPVARDSRREPLKRRTSELGRRKHVGQAALQPLEDLLEAPEGDALLAQLKAVEGGRTEADFPGKLLVGQVAPLSSQEYVELFFQWPGHAADWSPASFHLRGRSIVGFSSATYKGCIGSVRSRWV